MSKRTCPRPIKGIDDKLAVLLGLDSSNLHAIATNRGLYEDIEGHTFDISNIEEAAKELKSFNRREAIKQELKKIAINERQLTKEYKKLKKSFPNVQQRLDCVNDIALIFSDVVDSLLEDIRDIYGEDIDREAIIFGVKKQDGSIIGGEGSIFSSVYRRLEESYSESFEASNNTELSNEEREQAKKDNTIFRNMLDNFSSLASLARLQLRDTEGIKLNNNVEYASEINANNLSDEDWSALYDISEETREAWQEKNDQKNSFTTVSIPVRRVLSKLPLFETKIEYNDNKPYVVHEVSRDSLYYPRFGNPSKMHQTLLDMLKGMQSSEHMMSILEENRSKYPWLEENDINEGLINMLKNDNMLRTQFYKNLKKNFQLYSQLTVRQSNGIYTFTTPILNKVQNDTFDKFKASLKLGNIIDFNISIFDNSGNINFTNIRRLIGDKNGKTDLEKQGIIKYYFEPQKSINQNGFSIGSTIERIDIFNNGPVYTDVQKTEIISNILKSLNIEHNVETIRGIVSRKSKKEYKKLKKALLNLAEYGLSKNGLYSDSSINGSISSDAFLKDKGAGSASKEGVLLEKVKKLTDVLASNDINSKRLSSRIPYVDKKGNKISMYSHVNPSYLGERIESINAFVESNDAEGFLNYLESEFLNCPIYCTYDNNNKRIILNKFVEELYNSVEYIRGNYQFKENSFAQNFSYKRLLGNYTTSFENFTSKEHAIDLIAEYLSEKQISNNSEYCWMPTFILGDSGVSKYIKVKRYSKKDGSVDKEAIINGIYNIYRSEIRRQQVLDITNKKLKSRGYSEIQNTKGKESKFTILSFLNEEEYQKMLSEDNTEAGVKSIIESHLNSSLENFKLKLNDLGLLEKKIVNGKEVYSYFDSSLRRGITLDSLIEDFYFNSRYAMMNQLQFFTVDPGFYKNTKDMQKRYKEVHAPGELLDVFAKDFDGNLYSEDGKERCVYFTDIEVNAENTNSLFMEALEANGYSKNSEVYQAYKKCSLTDGQGFRTLDSYRKVMGMSGLWTLKMEQAFIKIKEIENKYININTTNRNNDEKEIDITIEERTEIEKLAVIFQPLKPYMYTIENYYLGKDKKSKDLYSKIPVQHKYAEAVLIPILLPINSRLRDIANWMQSKEIDLLAATSAVKNGSFGDVEISDTSNYKELSERLDSAYLHELEYSDYKIQNNVPNHNNNSRMFATQIRKLILSGINKLGLYPTYLRGNSFTLNGSKRQLNGGNIVALYNALISANIIDSVNSFMDKIGNIDSLSKSLIQNVINNSRESSDNILSYSLTEDEKFLIPLFEGSLEHDSAATILSMLRNDVNKQMINGGSAVQVSALGITGYNEDEGLKYIVDVNNPKNILYAECEIPFDFSYTDSKGNTIQLEYDKYVNEDGSVKLSNHEVDITKPENRIYQSFYKKENGKKKYYIPQIEVEYPNILSIIAYRIPTERHYSMLNVRVVRFSSRTAGGTIKVPAQGVIQAGFDFDIDKLYFIRYQHMEKKQNELSNKLLDTILGGFKGTEDLQIHEFIDYNFDINPEDNSRVARNNLIFELIRDRLMDQETFKQRYTPGGFENAKKAARFMRELVFGNYNWNSSYSEMKNQSLHSEDPEPNYDPTDPYTLIVYNQQNQVAGKLIGIFANQNSNHAFCTLLDTFKLNEPIKLMGHEYSDLIHAPKDVDVDRNVSELLASSVDAVKDPVLNFLNLNTITADSAALMIRAGFTFEEVGLFLNQPIVKEVCDYAFNNKCSLQIAIDNIKFTISKAHSDIAASVDTLHITKDSLVSCILSSRAFKEQQNKNLLYDSNTEKALSYVRTQLSIIELLSSISRSAHQVSSFISATKFTATNSLGSTFGDFYESKMRLSSFIDSQNTENPALTIVASSSRGLRLPVSTYDNMASRDMISQQEANPLSYEQVMYSAFSKAIKKMCEKYFPYETSLYKGLRKSLQFISKNNSLTSEQINSLHSEIPMYLLSGYEGSIFNGESLSKYPELFEEGNISNREFYLKVFPNLLYQAFKESPEEKNSNMLFQYLAFHVNEETGEVSMNIENVGGLESHEKEAIKESWESLMSNEQTKFFAEGLFMYNYYTAGFKFTPFTFMNLCPSLVKENIMVTTNLSYIDFLNTIQNDGTTSMFSINFNYFIPQYIRNHVEDKSFVTYPTKKLKNGLQGKVINGDEVAQRFSINISEVIGKNSNLNELLRNYDKENSVVYFAPAIYINDTLYIASGDGPAFNSSYLETGNITYIAKSVLGITKKTCSYVLDESNFSPIVTSNDIIQNETIEEYNDEANENEDIENENNKIVDEIFEGSPFENEDSEDFRLEELKEKASKTKLVDSTGQNIC